MAAQVKDFTRVFILGCDDPKMQSVGITGPYFLSHRHAINQRTDPPVACERSAARIFSSISDLFIIGNYSLRRMMGFPTGLRALLYPSYRTVDE